eukprot:Skav202297  [mRNA]  locus=scaffold60:29059:52659:+ [translate_table: standard]
MRCFAQFSVIPICHGPSASLNRLARAELESAKLCIRQTKGRWYLTAKDQGRELLEALRDVRHVRSIRRIVSCINTTEGMKATEAAQSLDEAGDWDSALRDLGAKHSQLPTFCVVCKRLPKLTAVVGDGNELRQELNQCLERRLGWSAVGRGVTAARKQRCRGAVDVGVSMLSDSCASGASMPAEVITSPGRVKPAVTAVRPVQSRVQITGEPAMPKSKSAAAPKVAGYAGLHQARVSPSAAAAKPRCGPSAFDLVKKLSQAQLGAPPGNVSAVTESELQKLLIHKVQNLFDPMSDPHPQKDQGPVSSVNLLKEKPTAEGQHLSAYIVTVLSRIMVDFSCFADLVLRWQLNPEKKGPKRPATAGQVTSESRSDQSMEWLEAHCQPILERLERQDQQNTELEAKCFGSLNFLAENGQLIPLLQPGSDYVPSREEFPLRTAKPIHPKTAEEIDEVETKRSDPLTNSIPVAGRFSAVSSVVPALQPPGDAGAIIEDAFGNRDMFSETITDLTDRYLMQEKLGEGTYGTVYKALCKQTHLHVAIKRIRVLLEFRPRMRLVLADFGLARLYNEIDTIFKIFRVLGTPDEEVWPGVSKLRDFKKTFPVWRNTDFAQVRAFNADALDLLRRCLKYNSSERPSAKRMLALKYFTEAETRPVEGTTETS